VRKDLLAGHADGMTYGAMVGLGETFLPAFVLAAGLGEVTAGLVASVPMLAGGVIQVVSPSAVRRLGSHRRWVILCATIQALAFVPLMLFAFSGGITAAAALISASVYWGAGLATGPAWNTWMGTIVPRGLRATFFARRTRLSQGAVLAGFLSGGLILQFAADRENLLDAFAAIFLLAGASRLISALCLSRQSEPVAIPVRARTISPASILRQFRKGNGSQLLFYLIVVQAAVQFSGPYFTPFMFEKLKLSYAAYVTLIAGSFVAKVFALPLWGRLAHRVGAFSLLWIGGIGIIPISGMWLVADNYAWLMVIQLFGGATWAAYELAFFLLFFESIPAEERTGVLTIYNLGNTTAHVSGSVLGGSLLYALGATASGYYWLFALSMVGRLVALLALRRVPRVSVESTSIRLRTVALRPNTASIDRPILTSLPEGSHDSIIEQPTQKPTQAVEQMEAA
jgi:MFS family permease